MLCAAVVLNASVRVQTRHGTGFGYNTDAVQAGLSCCTCAAAAKGTEAGTRDVPTRNTQQPCLANFGQ